MENLKICLNVLYQVVAYGYYKWTLEKTRDTKNIGHKHLTNTNQYK